MRFWCSIMRLLAGYRADRSLHQLHPWGPKVAPAAIYRMLLRRSFPVNSRIARLGSRFVNSNNGC